MNNKQASNRIAIIPARGGSKRIPHKNIIDFMGKPLLAHTIDAALASKAFGQVIVSTDDEKIAEVAIKHGAKVPFMRDKYADDFSNVSQVIAYTLTKLEKDFDQTYDVVAQLMPNCPMRNALDIEAAIAFFEAHESPFQVSAFSFGWMNPWWAFYMENDQPKKLFEAKAMSRSQDLKQLYCPTGAIWVANSKALQQSQNFYGEGYKVYLMDWKSAVDIDDYEDMEMAKAVYLMRHGV